MTDCRECVQVFYSRPEKPGAYVGMGIELCPLHANTPKLVEALRLILFAVTSDADANDGKVDRTGIAETVRQALASAGVQA